MSVLVLPERFDRTAVSELGQRIRESLRSGERLRLDLSGVESFDSSGMAVVVEALDEAKRQGVDVELVGVKEPVLDFFSLLSVGKLLEDESTTRKVGVFERVGASLEALGCEVRNGFQVISRSLSRMFSAPMRGERMRIDRVIGEVLIAGCGALPILVLIAFLLGLILAMQAYVQLKIFAAEIFVADMVAVSVTREIGPLMTAILVAARSGSSIAAQLGTMVINEEVDALRQMGVNPLSYLVAPKVVALTIATPCLVVFFCAVAMFGGMLFGIGCVDMHWLAYIEQTSKALDISDLATCLVKASVFGALIASVGCALGINVRGGPEGVGRATTRAVVVSVFGVIVIDAIFVAVLSMGA